MSRAMQRLYSKLERDNPRKPQEMKNDGAAAEFNLLAEERNKEVLVLRMMLKKLGESVR